MRELDGTEEEKNTKFSIQEQWKPLCESIIKINFDGAFDVYQARSVFGVVARNSSGEMLASMVVCHKAIPSLFATEAHACYQALRLGVRLGLDSIVIEGDSLTIIKKCSVSAASVRTGPGFTGTRTIALSQGTRILRLVKD
ncbi:hypothetical protein Goshw_004927, partial [Gossypium schwendimanii]|nr:hypothetical protein [Gossypium schwendimanii]